MLIAFAGLRLPANIFDHGSKVAAQPGAVGIAVAVGDQVASDEIQPSQNIIQNGAIAVRFQPLGEGKVVSHGFAVYAHRGPDIGLQRDSLRW